MPNEPILQQAHLPVPSSQHYAPQTNGAEQQFQKISDNFDHSHTIYRNTDFITKNLKEMGEIDNPPPFYENGHFFYEVLFISSLWLFLSRLGPSLFSRLAKKLDPKILSFYSGLSSESTASKEDNDRFFGFYELDEKDCLVITDKWKEEAKSSLQKHRTDNVSLVFKPASSSTWLFFPANQPPEKLEIQHPDPNRGCEQNEEINRHILKDVNEAILKALYPQVEVDGNAPAIVQRHPLYEKYIKTLYRLLQKSRHRSKEDNIDNYELTFAQGNIVLTDKLNKSTMSDERKKEIINTLKTFFTKDQLEAIIDGINKKGFTYAYAHKMREYLTNKHLYYSVIFGWIVVWHIGHMILGLEFLENQFVTLLVTIGFYAVIALFLKCAEKSKDSLALAAETHKPLFLDRQRHVAMLESLIKEMEDKEENSADAEEEEKSTALKDIKAYIERKGFKLSRGLDNWIIFLFIFFWFVLHAVTDLVQKILHNNNPDFDLNLGDLPEEWAFGLQITFFAMACFLFVQGYRGTSHEEKKFELEYASLLNQHMWLQAQWTTLKNQGQIPENTYNKLRRIVDELEARRQKAKDNYTALPYIKTSLLGLRYATYSGILVPRLLEMVLPGIERGKSLLIAAVVLAFLYAVISLSRDGYLEAQADKKRILEAANGILEAAIFEYDKPQQEEQNASGPRTPSLLDSDDEYNQQPQGSTGYPKSPKISTSSDSEEKPEEHISTGPST